MLSPFVKRLLFARQFVLDEGQVQVLGEPESLLPIEFVIEFQRSAPEKVYKIAKSSIARFVREIGSKLGAKPQDLIKRAPDVFELIGLGRLELQVLDLKKKKVIVNVYNSPLPEYENRKCCCCIFTAGVLAGLFSTLLGKDLNAKEVKCVAKGDLFCQFVVS